MKKIKLSFHPLFFLFTLFLLLTGKILIFVNYLVVIIIHEYAHAFVAKKLGYEIKNIRLLPFGVSLNLQNTSMEPKDEFYVAIAGPLINFLLFIMCLSLWWTFPVAYGYLYLFAYANFITGVINLIPVFPMDGGRVLVSIFSNYYKRESIKKAVYLVNIAFSICLFAFFFVFIKYLNLTLLFMAIFTLLAGFPMKREEYNYKILDINGLKKNTNVSKAKIIVVKEGTCVYKIFRHISKNYYLIVYVIDKNEKVTKIIHENNLLKLIENGSLSEV